METESKSHPERRATAALSSFAAVPIQAVRLRLVPLAAQHVKDLSQLLADARLHRFIGPSTASQLRRKLARQLQGPGRPGVYWCNWALQDVGEDRLVGTVQATISSRDDRLTAVIAWTVGVPWQRRGLAQEAARALVDWLQTAEVTKVIAYIHPEHLASQSVARSVSLLPTGEWLDGEIVWALELG
jgi:RimJ/RimL family protein N-acetyltransferase